MEILRAMWQDDQGQDLVEYALIAALIAVAAILAMQALGNEINAVFNSIGGKLNNAVT